VGGGGQNALNIFSRRRKKSMGRKKHQWGGRSDREKENTARSEVMKEKRKVTKKRLLKQSFQ